ncbi:Protein of unknown function [Pseudooceanicola antarcticus]|uniref:DUF2867 domain-containing protein n=1 Tax=Pseudooceanicola antarcticus TaxID=1247613 RepID=A0A285HIC4_9RHOB|nr:DUF2867 domain-containing protein [Pseudooceanicola antarcticus]PJE28004.1 DUF2867 domain-containing protein [Pseudooceanicola antarcticus]SNY35363.1 Protein of unknown function [Pseudooceanicola antarcticus]
MVAIADVPLVAPRGALNYLDHRSRALPKGTAPLTALEVWTAMMAKPLPGMAPAFRLRDAISACFGVRRIGGFSGARVDQVAAGDHLDFFLVEEVRPDLLVLTERDRHLDVMTCLSLEPGAGTGPVVTVTSSVRVHNVFGRLYMLPVGLAHRVIVVLMLRRLPQALAARDRAA